MRTRARRRSNYDGLIPPQCGKTRRMRDLIVTENITIDGVIDAAGGWFAPAGGQDDVADLEAALLEQREAADALLLGRVTFEQMRGYWPQQKQDEAGITAYLDRVSKYVVSSTLHNRSGTAPTCCEASARWRR